MTAATHFDHTFFMRRHNVSMTTRPIEPIEFTEQVEPQAFLFQLLDPAIRADPYPLCARLREHGPLHLPEANFVLFSSFGDCDEVLRHPSSCSDQTKSTVVQRRVEEEPALGRDFPPGFLFLDPPDHTRLRKLVSKAFAPKVVNALRPEISSLVDGLLDRIAEQGRFDVVSDFAYPLPVAVICRLLGVPLEDEPQFSQASALLAQALDPFFAFTGQNAENLNDSLEAGQWLRRYLRDLIALRRSQPGEDLMSGLVAVEESGDQLTEDEIVSTCVLLLVAGHETTVNLIGNAILAMLRDRRQWAQLGADPDRAAAVVEETMRYDPPVQLIGRIAGADMVIGDVEVTKGDVMMMLVAAAHRDPAEYDRPEEFDPDRGAVRHLGFGRGAHYCLGAPLARLEAAVALSAIAARFPKARLDGEPQYKTNVTLRGLESMTVALS
ncbi:cytochrome P450 [Mycobacterium marinum]|nr:cytochrome P450 [Mycobacterium marinum]GJO12083.1 cytochrome P450 [Mycobacterium marinum]GJO12589.1 cytochrome P450 [Mycobacterium marinum]GJO28741.1 cytochrome P450 [Mycobacterium marinum]GJO42499.1 cytochrome P450 [Mycobacterium marinum]